MDPYTTESPSEIILDESDYFHSEEMRQTLPPRLVDHGKLAAQTIYVIFAGLSSLCVMITVIRTKSVRDQILGVMLINLAIAVLIRVMVVVSREIETVSRGGIGNFGTLGCHLYFLGMFSALCAANVAIAIICLDIAFSLPRNRKAQIIVTVCIWSYAIIFALIMTYGTIKLTVHKFDKLCGGPFRWPFWVMLLLLIVGLHIIPTAFVLVALIKFCYIVDKGQYIDSKKLPFILTTIIYLLLCWVDQLVWCLGLGSPSHDLSSSLFMIKESGMVVISLIWLFFTPDLRNKCLCRETIDDDAIVLVG